MNAKIYKNGKWNNASKEDIMEFMKIFYGIDVDDADKVKIWTGDKWVKGSEIVIEG